MVSSKLPWIRPGVVVHEPAQAIDGLLARFALAIRERGFSVVGYVQRNNVGATDLGRGCASTVELEDLASGERLRVDPHDEDSSAAAVDRLGDLKADNVDLFVVSRFSAFEKAAGGMRDVLARSALGGTPVLTSIAGRCLHKWHGLTQRGGAMIPPDIESIWRWWGPDRLYRDLALGIADQEVRRIVFGPRWVMVEATTGSGLAYLPRSPKDIQPRVPELQRLGLRRLADLIHSWEPLEMALGVAAVNAHYNRRDQEGIGGNGTESFRDEVGRVVVVGAFPGLANMLPKAVVIETDPRPGELPTIATDTVVPGCAAVVVNSSTLINRKLPHILQLAEGARAALIGPSTPLTPRLYDYGVEVLGGLVVRNPDGLAEAVRSGVPPKDFGQFGRYIHIRAPGRCTTGNDFAFPPEARRRQCAGRRP